VFYQTDLPPDITDLTWRRLLDPAVPMIGRIAECDGAIAGFSVSVVHVGTWFSGPACYLEDLFVDPARRGSGIGRAPDPGSRRSRPPAWLGQPLLAHPPRQSRPQAL
jgi:GNAT superfamily N-acetyltransferase